MVTQRVRAAVTAVSAAFTWHVIASLVILVCAFGGGFASARFAGSGAFVTLGHVSNFSSAAQNGTGCSLLDGGATHYVHSNDAGAIPGTWRPDVPGLSLGDNSFIKAYGSVEKDFIPPSDVGGPDIRRRVLIAPNVATRVWSQGMEVDVYGSSYVDAPRDKHILLKDGRRLPVRVASNGLRWLDLTVRPTNSSAVDAHTTLRRAATVAPHTRAMVHRITGVGKRFVPLPPLEFLRLWHCILGHISSSRLLTTLRHTLVLANVPTFSAAVVKAYNQEHCDVCNAFLQRRAAVSHNVSSSPTPTPRSDLIILPSDVPSPARSLTPLWTSSGPSLGNPLNMGIVTCSAFGASALASVGSSAAKRTQSPTLSITFNAGAPA
jgi:hypothetical protein